MKKKLFAAIIAVIVAVLAYFGGWEIIKFFGSYIFSSPWNPLEILILALMTFALICACVIFLIIVYHRVMDIIDK